LLGITSTGLFHCRSSFRNLSSISMVLALSLSAHSQIKINIPGLNRPVPQRPAVTRQPARASADEICPPLVSWEAQLNDHYPGIDLMRAPAARLASMAIPLFADESFKPFFGKNYLDLSPQELDTLLHQNIIFCATST
jgi:hypothetical protein